MGVLGPLVVAGRVTILRRPKVLTVVPVRTLTTVTHLIAVRVSEQEQ